MGIARLAGLRSGELMWMDNKSIRAAQGRELGLVQELMFEA